MNTTDTHNEKIAKLTLASVYPHYLVKVTKKGRTEEELITVIKWLCGINDKELQDAINEKITFDTFFKKVKLNPNSHMITGLICGYRVEELKNPLTQKVRYLDKLVDELAKGKSMDKILRTK